MTEQRDDGRREEPQRGPLLRTVFRFLGPADLGPEHRGNPLVGTDRDPVLRRAAKQAKKDRKQG